MMIKRIEGATRVLGQSQGYLGLPVLDTNLEDGTPVMVTAWEPTPKEIEAIQNGAPVFLQVLGTAHPPVNLWVGVSE
jgi:hypothetical protein